MIFALMGKTCSGKTFLMNKVLDSKVNRLSRAITYTTRTKRDNEVNSLDYHFVNKEHFEEMIESNDMLEYTKVGEHYYGTHRLTFSDDTKHYICVLDYGGYAYLKKLYKDHVVGFMVHLEDSTRKELYCNRGGNTNEFDKREEVDNKRFKKTHKDLSLYHVFNNIDDYGLTVEKINDIISLELSN